MWGELFESMYEGSMIGAGAHVFATWAYVLARQAASRKYGSVVELNPKLLAWILGEDRERVFEAIEYLCAPDPENKNQERQGRRLVRVSKFTYQVVEGAKYRAMRAEENRREQNRRAKRKERGEKPVEPVTNPKPQPTPLQEQFQAKADPPIRQCWQCGSVTKSCTQQVWGIAGAQWICATCERVMTPPEDPRFLDPKERVQAPLPMPVEQPFATPVMVPPTKPPEIDPPARQCTICGRPHGPGPCPAL